MVGEVNTSLQIFRRADNTSYASMQIGEFIISNNEIIKKHLVSCYSTTTVNDVNGKSCPEGTKGMYDLLTGEFYTNQGTGNDFTAGPDV